MTMHTGARRALDRTRHAPGNLGWRLGRATALGALLLSALPLAVPVTANTQAAPYNAHFDKALIDEGQSITLTFSIADPDPGDAHVAYVLWNDPGNPTGAQVINVPAGQLTVQVSHVFPDDDYPSQLAVVVGVDDTADHPEDNSHEATFAEILVKNVAPRIVESSMSVTKKGSLVTVEGDFTDPGADSFEATATWGDTKSPVEVPCTVSNKHVICQHIYQAGLVPPGAPPKPYAIAVTVKDDDAGKDQYKTTVQLP
jgi:hypothetical protein